MAAVWTRLLLLGVFVAVAHGLTCRRCPIAILGRCLVASDDVECDNSTRSCFTRTASHGLTCSRCPIAIFGQCLFPRHDVHCNTSTSSCFTRTMLFNATGCIRPQSQGCVPSTACNQTGAGAFLGIGYTFSVACCGTDLCNGETPCNGGTSVQLSLAAACVAVLASLWAP
ncbi:unnamed protein product [Arctogadus glacialis]